MQSPLLSKLTALEEESNFLLQEHRRQQQQQKQKSASVIAARSSTANQPSTNNNAPPKHSSSYPENEIRNTEEKLAKDSAQYRKLLEEAFLQYVTVLTRDIVEYLQQTQPASAKKFIQTAPLHAYFAIAYHMNKTCPDSTSSSSSLPPARTDNVFFLETRHSMYRASSFSEFLKTTNVSPSVLTYLRDKQWIGVKAIQMSETEFQEFLHGLPLACLQQYAASMFHQPPDKTQLVDLSLLFQGILPNAPILAKQDFLAQKLGFAPQPPREIRFIGFPAPMASS
jgi:hypothetical protein